MTATAHLIPAAGDFAVLRPGNARGRASDAESCVCSPTLAIPCLLHYTRLSKTEQRIARDVAGITDAHAAR